MCAYKRRTARSIPHKNQAALANAVPFEVKTSIISPNMTAGSSLDESNRSTASISREMHRSPVGRGNKRQFVHWVETGRLSLSQSNTMPRLSSMMIRRCSRLSSGDKQHVMDILYHRQLRRIDLQRVLYPNTCLNPGYRCIHIKSLYTQYALSLLYLLRNCTECTMPIFR